MGELEAMSDLTIKGALPFMNVGRLRWGKDENGEAIVYLDHLIIRELLEGGVERVRFTIHEESPERKLFYDGPTREGRD